MDEKPSRNEDEYFAKQDAELMRQMRSRADEDRSTEMNKCPRCGTALEEQEREGVKIDVCPSCGGIWLDKGELEILQRVEKGKSGGFFGSFISSGRK